MSTSKTWKYNNVMIDIETMGNIPGSSIISIGAVCFDKNNIGPNFYSVINRQSNLDVGLFETPSTVEWWNNQSDAARKVIEISEMPSTQHLGMVLAKFTNWLESRTNRKYLKAWGNGSDFDNALLAVAYHKTGGIVPWDFWNNRCYRTIKATVPDIKIERGTGTHHNALDDAKAQAEHLIRIWASQS